MTYTEKLVSRVVDESFEDLPPAAVVKTKQALLDDIGCAFMGYEMGYGKVLSEYATELGGKPQSTIIGSGAKASADIAAGVNSQLAYDSNIMETGAGGHAFSGYAQTAIAVGESVGSSGKDLVTAAALAYEINGRFFTAVKSTPNRYGSVDTGRHTIACATIAAGKMLGLNETQMGHAFGLQWYIEPPVSGFTHGQSPWWEGMGSVANVLKNSVAVQAARLAQKGYTGPVNVFDNDPVYDLDRLVDFDSGGRYHYVTDELQLKLWVAPRVSGGGVYLVSEIVKREGLTPEDIDQIVFMSRRDYLRIPFSVAEPPDYWVAHLSVPWLISMVILVGLEKSGPEWFTKEILKDRRAIELSKKVKILEDPEATAAWESADTMRGRTDSPVTVEVHAKGKVHTEKLLSKDILGSSGNPLSQEQVEEKFVRLAGRIIGVKQSNEIIELMGRLEELPDIREVTKLFAPR